jgi:hypothetical protein
MPPIYQPRCLPGFQQNSVFSPLFNTRLRFSLNLQNVFKTLADVETVDG